MEVFQYKKAKKYCNMNRVFYVTKCHKFGNFILIAYVFILTHYHKMTSILVFILYSMFTEFFLRCKWFCHWLLRRLFVNFLSQLPLRRLYFVCFLQEGLEDVICCMSLLDALEVITCRFHLSVALEAIMCRLSLSEAL
jgi:hypothetical protein